MRKGYDDTDYREALKCVPKPDGKHCVICGEDLPPRKRKYCSDECSMFIHKHHPVLYWPNVKEKAKKRDGHMCRKCGYKPFQKWPSYFIGKKFETLKDIPEKRLEREFEAYWIEEWNGFRMEFYTPDNNSSELEVHHIILVSEGGAEFDLDNCITLCKKCHKFEHGAIQNKIRRLGISQKQLTI